MTVLRKAALAPALTLLLTLTFTAAPALDTPAVATSPHDTGTGYLPYATDFVFPVGNPRMAPNYYSTEPNGYQITQMFNNSCDPALGQGYYLNGYYFCGHTGVDLSDRQAGGEVHATATGLVTYAAYNSSYGLMVRIKHLLPSGIVVYSQYEHMMSVSVGYGQIVAMGQTIGYVGSTGFVTGPHLHFEIKSTDDPGVGYTFGNPAYLIGYYEPISFVLAHTAQLLPTPTDTPLPTFTPTSVPTYNPSSGGSVTATSQDTNAAVAAAPVGSGITTTVAASTTMSSTGSTALGTGEHAAVLASFNKKYKAYVVVVADHLNVRSGSDFAYTPMNSVKKGARLGYLGMAGNGWVHVALPSDVTGYVARQWVTGSVLPALPPIVASSKLKPPFCYVTNTPYPARSGPHMHDPAIEVLKKGERLTYLGTLGSWDKVILPSGRIGWVLNWYLREPKVRINLAPPATPRSSSKTGSVTCPCVITAVDGLRLRRGPSLSSSIIEFLSKGTRLSLHGYYTSWVGVTAPDGQRGYVMRTYVHILGSVATPNTQNGGAQQTDATSNASTSTNSTNTSAHPRVTDADKSALPAGYVAPFVYVDVDHANVRLKPNLEATVLVSEPRDTRLALLGSQDGWDHILSRTGIVGWIKAELVRTSP